MSAYVGLDVHKESTFATVVDQNGRVVVRRRVANELVHSFLESFNVEKIDLESARAKQTQKLLFIPNEEEVNALVAICGKKVATMCALP
jgi:hypothetical protein